MADGREDGGEKTVAQGLSPRVRRVVLWLNAAGFAFFLWWLFTLRDSAILREQEGILYFLPCLPFLFVQLLLTPRGTPAEKDKGRDAREKPEDARGDGAERGEG